MGRLRSRHSALCVIVTITLLAGACSDAARPAGLEDALIDAADLGSRWSESPSQDRAVKFDWCTGESTPVEDRTEVAFIAWSNDEAPSEVVGERIERYSGTGAEPRVSPPEGLPCDYVEAGTTVRVSEQAGAEVGDESHVYLMEATEGPDKGARFVWQVQAVSYTHLTLPTSDLV